MRARSLKQRAKEQRIKLLAYTKDDLLKEPIPVEAPSVRYSIPREDSMVAKPPKANRFSEAMSQRETAISMQDNRNTVVELIEEEEFW